MKFLTLMTAGFLLAGCGDCTSENTVGDDDLIPTHVAKIRDARAKIAPMKESILQKTTEEYNLQVKDGAWPEWAQSCLAYRDVFETAEDLTLFPAAFVAGIAMHESAGCRMSASDWAGGKGFMQLTHIDKRRHVDPIAKMLGIERSDMHERTDPLHNVLVGIAVLDDYERRLGSRPHGILAYNMGVGGVKKHARKAGWTSGPLPEIVVLKPYLRYDRMMKPRAYVQRILAATIMMDKAMRGEPIERKEGGLFVPEEIPGWDPKDDGDGAITAAN